MDEGAQRFKDGHRLKKPLAGVRRPRPAEVAARGDLKSSDSIKDAERVPWGVGRRGNGSNDEHQA